MKTELEELLEYIKSEYDIQDLDVLKEEIKKTELDISIFTS